MPLTITNILYCTVNISRVKEENINKVQPKIIRQVIENGIYITEGYKS